MTVSISPRKIAKQRRSQQKIDLILQTTFQMLSQQSAAVITTNAIAKTAGISIGTLYQFFPNKDAIFYQLYKDWLAKTRKRLVALDQAIAADLSVSDCIDVLLEALAGSDDVNSRANWQLRRAMATSEALVELETQHQKEILERLIDLQKVFDCTVPADERTALAMFQNQVTIACLQSLALAENSDAQQATRVWCRTLLQSVFNYKNLNETP